MTSLQEKIDACWRLANDPGATEAERETARRFAERLEAKLNGGGAKPKQSKSAAQSEKASWDDFHDSSWGDAWFTGQYSDIYEAVDDFLRNAKGGRGFYGVPIGIHSPRVGGHIVVMGRCDMTMTQQIHTMEWSTGYSQNVPGMVSTDMRVDFVLDHGPRSREIEGYLHRMFVEHGPDTTVVVPYGAGSWLHGIGILHEINCNVIAPFESRRVSQKTMLQQYTLLFYLDDFAIHDRVVTSPVRGELPESPRRLGGEQREMLLEIGKVGEKKW